MSNNYGNRKRPLTAEEKIRILNRRKKEKRKIRIMTYIFVAVIVAIVALIIVIATNNRKKTVSNDNPLESESATETTAFETRSVELVAVGDVLMHTPLLNYARSEDGSYDFNSIFEVMKDDISRADIAVCNQETPIDTTRDADGGIQFIFNTPGAIGDAEINAGFDVVTQASNHSYDMGTEGVLNTANFWKSKADSIKMIGMNTTQEERDSIPIYEKNGIKFALLNYAYGLNGFVLPEDMDYLVTIIDDYHRDIIISDIQKASSLADFVIVFPHWGTEDVVGDTTDFQDEWARVFADAGADLIIGTHPHVCEKIEWIVSDSGNKALCYYSLGNYASNQQEIPEVLGGMAKVKIVKDESGTYIDESATGVVPIVTHNVPWGDFTEKVVCYKLSDYTEELAAEHDIYVNGRDTRYGGFSAESLNNLANEIFGNWIINY